MHQVLEIKFESILWVRFVRSWHNAQMSIVKWRIDSSRRIGFVYTVLVSLRHQNSSHIEGVKLNTWMDRFEIS